MLVDDGMYSRFFKRRESGGGENIKLQEWAVGTRRKQKARSNKSVIVIGIRFTHIFYVRTDARTGKIIHN